MKKVVLLLSAMVIGLLMSGCATNVPFFCSTKWDSSQLSSGMTEEEVISVMGTRPISRSEAGNGTYLLQWLCEVHPDQGTEILANILTGDAHLAEKGGFGSRHYAILFGTDHRMIRIMVQTDTSAGR